MSASFPVVLRWQYWITIDSINPIPTTGTTKTYTNNLSAYINFRFTYTKGAGNMAFDDVKISFSSAVSDGE